MANNKKTDKSDFLLTPRFTMCFPELFKAVDPFNNGRPKFSVLAVWDPSSFTDDEKKLWAAILAKVDEECVRVHGKKWDALRRLRSFKSGILPAEEKEKFGEPFVEGNVMANLTTTMPPGICDWVKDPRTGKCGDVLEGSPLVYPGARARCKVSVYAFENVSSGFALGLCNLQVLPGGRPLVNRPSASDEFDAEEYGDELADLPALDDGAELPL